MFSCIYSFNKENKKIPKTCKWSFLELLALRLIILSFYVPLIDNDRRDYLIALHEMTSFCSWLCLIVSQSKWSMMFKYKHPCRFLKCILIYYDCCYHTLISLNNIWTCTYISNHYLIKIPQKLTKYYNLFNKINNTSFYELSNTPKKSRTFCEIFLPPCEFI